MNPANTGHPMPRTALILLAAIAPPITAQAGDHLDKLRADRYAPDSPTNLAGSWPRAIGED
jgi:hypothetical protein